MGQLGRTQKSQAAASEKKLCELERKLEARTRELAEARGHLAEALEQQAATSGVLRVISSSPGDLQPVLDTILANATRLCEAKFGFLFLRERDNFRGLAMHGAVATPYVDWWRREPVVDIRGRPHVPLARIARHKEVLHIPDLKADQAYIERDPRIVAFTDSCGARSNLHVPMLKESELVGAIVIYRQEVRPFTDKQAPLPGRSMACSTAPNPTASPPKSWNAGETCLSRQNAAVSPDVCLVAAQADVMLRGTLVGLWSQYQ